MLLQPSTQTLLADLNSITNDSHFIWTQEDKYSLESQLLLATAQPLCLTPNPAVSIVKSKLHLQKNRMNERQLKKFSMRYTESYRLKTNRWSQYALPFPFRLLKTKKNNSSSTGIKDSTEFFNSLLQNSRNYSLDKRYQQELNERSNTFQVKKKFKLLSIPLS
jgi:hypothetical protein